MAAGELEAVIGADEVRLDEDARRAADARHDARLGRALDERVDLADGEQILELADVAVGERDARLAQPREVQLAAAAVEAVERDDLVLWMARRERDSEVRADEPGAARDEDPAAHAVRRRIAMNSCWFG